MPNIHDEVAFPLLTPTTNTMFPVTDRDSAGKETRNVLGGDLLTLHTTAIDHTPIPTTAQKAGLDNANALSGVNPAATMADLSNPPSRTVNTDHTLVAADIGRTVELLAGVGTLTGAAGVGADGDEVTFWNISGGTVTLANWTIPNAHTKLVDGGALACRKIAGVWRAAGTTEP